MALVKNPKAARARAAKSKIRATGRKKLKKLAVKASPLDALVPGGSAKRGTVTVARKAYAATVADSPHGLVGNIPLGHRSPRYDEPVQVLQASEDFRGSCDAERLVARMLIEEFRQRHPKRHPGDEWFAWIGTISYHPTGLIYWIGLSSNVPAGAFGVLEVMIAAMGFKTTRATAIPEKHGLEPLLYLGDDGLELLRLI